MLITYGGALVRRAGFDGGLCDLADILLGEIHDAAAGPDLPCIAASDDAYGPLSTTIRVGFPGSVWSLPFVAHELGHHLAFRHVRTVSPLLTVLPRPGGLGLDDAVAADRVETFLSVLERDFARSATPTPTVRAEPSATCEATSWNRRRSARGPPSMPRGGNARARPGDRPSRCPGG